MLGITWSERKRATWIREQTKVEDILMTMKKNWSWAGHIMHRTDNIWTKKVTEWQPRNSKRSQGKQKIRCRDEIVAFAFVEWSTLTSDRGRSNWLGKGLCPTVE